MRKLFLVLFGLFLSTACFADSEAQMYCNGVNKVKKISSKGGITYWKCTNSPITFALPDGVDPFNT